MYVSSVKWKHLPCPKVHKFDMLHTQIAKEMRRLECIESGLHYARFAFPITRKKN
jgi:hypothetical protein